MIWFTSDTHFHHKNICKGVSNWENKEGCRNFDTIEEMNKTLIDNINAVVKEDDTLYHLGDWSFGGIERIWEFRKAIHCKNVHLILGNHDHHIYTNRTIFIPVDEWHNTYGYNVSCHYEIQSTKTGTVYCVSAKDLFSSVKHYEKIKINGKIFVLCHYAMRVWDDSHHGAIMLYGHSHGTLDELKPKFTDPTWIGENYYLKNYKTMDVGIDTHSEFRPYSITEIVDIMKHKDILFIDHHSEETN